MLFGGQRLLSCPWLAGGTFEGLRTLPSFWLWGSSQFLSGCRERIKKPKCLPLTDIHLPCQRMEKEGVIKKVVVFLLFCCQKPMPLSLLLFHDAAVYHLVASILRRIPPVSPIPLTLKLAGQRWNFLTRQRIYSWYGLQFTCFSPSSLQMSFTTVIFSFFFFHSWVIVFAFIMHLSSVLLTSEGIPGVAWTHTLSPVWFESISCRRWPIRNRFETVMLLRTFQERP